MLTPTRTGPAKRSIVSELNNVPFRLFNAVPNNCRYATNKTALPIVSGIVPKNLPNGGITPRRVNKNPLIMNGPRLNNLVLCKNPIVDVNGVKGTKPKIEVINAKIPVTKIDLLY